MVNPPNKLKIIKIFNKLVQNNIPSEVFSEAFAESDVLLKTDQKSVFSSTINNTFGKFLFEYAIQIRSGAKCRKARCMYAVSK